MDELQAVRGRLLRWLREDALPLWERHGVDRQRGGYFETIAVSGSGDFEARGPLRRGRVVARQMFVFDAGRRLGWQARHADPVRHGCEFLFTRLQRDDGLFHTAIDSDFAAAGAAFDLYEHAFYVFSLARVHDALSPGYATLATATACLASMRRGWGKSNGGFDESRPPSLPLKSNPHLHLFEAALAWIETCEGVPPVQAPWVQLASELCELCLGRFIDPGTGAVREFFDSAWQPMQDDSGRIVEPGHQFEWAWLLLRWAGLRHCPVAQREPCHRAARRLAAVGECGVDPVRAVAVNELWDDMTPKEASAKLWPQTERVKAWCALWTSAESLADKQAAADKLHEALLSMLRYLRVDAPGLWHEVLLPNDCFRDEACKASSLYHIVGAIEALDGCCGG